MTHAMRRRALAGTFALVAALGTVSACGDGGGTPVAGDDSTATTAGTPTTATSPSTTVGQGLPEGFPEDEVPLLDEKVVNGVKGSDGGPFAWSVVMTSTRSVEDLSAEVVKDYAAAGYKSDESTELGDVSIHRFSSSSYQVGVTIARTGDGITITYLVKDQA
jgi:hypothetical protein